MAAVESNGTEAEEPEQTDTEQQPQKSQGEAFEEIDCSSYKPRCALEQLFSEDKKSRITIQCQSCPSASVLPIPTRAEWLLGLLEKCTVFKID